MPGINEKVAISNWDDVIGRLKSSSQDNRGMAILNIKVLIYDGHPVLWIRLPTQRLESSAPRELLAYLTEGIY